MRPFYLGLAAASLMISGCATTGQISSDYDQAQDFTSYQTFAWARANPILIFGDRMIPPLVQAQVADAIKADLAAKGYRYTQNLEEADFAVSYTIGTRENVEFREMPDPFWANRMNWRWGGAHWPTIQTPTISRMQYREYTDGTLSIDIYDVDRKAPVWHGAGQRSLTRQELRGDANSAAEDTKKILAGFPPQ